MTKRTALTPLDFSKAIDLAWKEDLLLRPVDKSLLLTFAKRLSDVLSNYRKIWKTGTVERGAAAGVSSIIAALLTENNLKTFALNDFD